MNEHSENQKRLVPKEFHSLATGEPFDKCIDCGKYLLDNEPYMIEKAIRQYPGYTAQDVVFEYAICQSCADRLKQELSEESMNNIHLFFNQNIQPENFFDGRETSKCLISDKPQSDLQEYQIYAYCHGKHLANHVSPPFMISGEILDKLADLLSDDTIDELNNFMDNHFGPPPELEDLPIGRRLILI